MRSYSDIRSTHTNRNSSSQHARHMICTMIPVSCASGHAQVAAHVEDAVSKGATVTIGGKKPDLPEPYNKVCHTASVFALKPCSQLGCALWKTHGAARKCH